MNILSEDFSLTELNRPDWNNMTVMSKKHTPIIEAPTKVKTDAPFAVKIKVGGIEGVEHPNTLSHWINSVALYAGKRLITKIDFGAELTDGFVVSVNVTLKQTTNLHAQASCNLHGIWEGKAVKVTVE